MPYAFNDRLVAEKLVEIAGNYKPGMGPAQLVPTKGNGWIFKTPSGGIPARSALIPGKAECTAYYIDPGGTLMEHLAPDGSQITLEVYNPFTVAVEGSTWITAKMVHNKPVVDAEDCNGSEPPVSWGGAI